MTEIIAHRGGALLWPENSRTAITNAVRLGVDQVQVDVHPTRDGRIAVIHDATLERTTDGVGAVAARSWAELSALTLQGTKGEGIPSLGEVVDLLRPSRATLRIEIKADVAKRIYPGFSALLARVPARYRICEPDDRDRLSSLPRWRNSSHMPRPSPGCPG